MTEADHPRQVAIAIAPNGGRRTKTDHPALPLSAAELARCATECLAAGAGMIHVHVRKPDGSHLLDAAAFRNVIAAIGAAVGTRMVVQITTESLGLYTPREQIAVLEAVRPEAASLALRELAPDAAAEAGFFRALHWMRRENVMPQIILYDPAEARRLSAMIARGDLPWPDVPVLYVLGRYTASQTSRPEDLLPFLAPDMPRFAHWSVCAFGRHEAACVTTAALLGGHVRVGFENNLLLPDGTVAPSNAALVRSVADTLRGLAMTPCSAAEIRQAVSA
ncbi:MAG: 3-keto-5-aminohexanoate cleavage protein [Parvibaculaceae bacterium]